MYNTSVLGVHSYDMMVCKKKMLAASDVRQEHRLNAPYDRNSKQWMEITDVVAGKGGL